MWSGGTMVSAAAMTWRRRARPPISWRTLGRLLLRRVPFPAAMMAMAKSGVFIQRYGLMFACANRKTLLGGVPSVSSPPVELDENDGGRCEREPGEPVAQQEIERGVVRCG